MYAASCALAVSHSSGVCEIGLQCEFSMIYTVVIVCV